MKDAVIVSGARTAIGKLGGSLQDVLVEQLASRMIRSAIIRAGIDDQCIDEVILGHGKQSSDTPNLARVASLYADLPLGLSAFTVHRQCGSGMQAVISGAQSIRLGESAVVVAGGAESMSTAPYYFRQARFGYRSGNGEILDPNTESQPKSQPVEKYGRITMGLTAENLAVKYGISREEQDEFALTSQTRALNAIATGRYEDEIVPVPVKKGKTMVDFVMDEFPKASTLEALGSLKPAFKKDGTVTAGNSSGRNDGAAAMVLMDREKAFAMEIAPMMRIVSYASAGVPPEIMGIGPVPATLKALERAGLTMQDIDLIELNEAFAAQSLAVVRELGIDRARLNVNGGAIALGHPIGCSGARIIVSLMFEMLKRKSRYGLATLCIAGGQGSAVILENMQI